MRDEYYEWIVAAFLSKSKAEKYMKLAQVGADRQREEHLAGRAPKVKNPYDEFMSTYYCGDRCYYHVVDLLLRDAEVSDDETV